MRTTKISIILTLITLFFLLSGCSSSKSGFVSKVYHDVTSRNNSYFNADLKVKTAQKSIEDAYVDDYEKILEIHTNRDTELAANYQQDLNTAKEKLAFAIQQHEPSKHTDDCYLLLGSIDYLQGNFEDAQKTFMYVNTEFKEDEQGSKTAKEKAKAKKVKAKNKKKSKKQKLKAAAKRKKQKAKDRKKRLKLAKKKKKKKGKSSSSKTSKDKEQAKKDKKKDDKEQTKNDTPETAPTDSTAVKQDNLEKPDGPALWWIKHNAVRPDAMIWLVDAYTAQEMYREAEAVITLIREDDEFPHWLWRDVQVAEANLYLQKGDIKKAMPPLERLTDDIKKKAKKSRYIYIMAQINEETGDPVGAILRYQEVLKARPSYIMAFNAKMSIARISAKDNSIPDEDVIKLLKKMLKDGKNEEFYDQIYYALAEIELKNNRTKEGIAYLIKSTEVSTNNTRQKAKSFNKIADLYYEAEEYAKSQPYYDSTLALISEDRPDYFDIRFRNDVLKRLVAEIDIVTLQDSLLALIRLPEDELRKKLQKKIDAKQARLEKEKKEKEIAESNELAIEVKPKNVPSESKGKGDWYWDNAGSIGSGYNEFINLWGKRKLEDNWRRKDKGSLEELEQLQDEDIVEEIEEVEELDFTAEMDSLMSTLPTSPEKQKASNAMIADALYKMGAIYRLELYNDKKAVETFEELLKRYPDNKYLAETYYNLYLLYDKAGNAEKRDYYKGKLLKEFPNSRFAKIINDPDYLKRSNKERDRLSRYYEETYNLLLAGDTAQVKLRLENVKKEFKENHLKPKFALLDALLTARTGTLGEFKQKLVKVISTYPGDEVRKKAEEIMVSISSSDDPEIRKEDNMLNYEYNERSIHFIMLTYADSVDIKATDLTQKIAQYNDVNFSTSRLRIQTIPANGYIMVIIKNFSNLKKAKSYYTALTNSTDAFAGLPVEQIRKLMISDVNFNKVMLHKEIESYFDFFDIRYVK